MFNQEIINKLKEKDDTFFTDFGVEKPNEEREIDKIINQDTRISEMQTPYGEQSPW